MVFLGFLLDTVNQLICIPMEKIDKALDMIEMFLNKKNKKVTKLQVQRLCGLLNFLSQAIIPGRTFVRRLYALAPEKLKQHHHVRVKSENRMDLLIWKRFLSSEKIYCCPFMEEVIITAEDIDMFSDASGSYSKGGAGAYCNKSWVFVQWDKNFMVKNKPSIEYLELFGVTMGVLLWINRFKNRKIFLFCDNKSVREMINHNTSGCKNCMVLIRIIVLKSMQHNVRIFAKYVKSKENDKADALSRLQFERFRNLDPEMEAIPHRVPEEIWPIDKIWLK